MILNSTTKKIQIILAAAKITNDCPVVAAYVDYTSSATTALTTLTNTNGLTAVDIVAAPGSSTTRKINWISICNKDTDFISVTVRLNDNGTTYNYTPGFSLAPNSTLQYTDTRGWIVIDNYGSEQIASG